MNDIRQDKNYGLYLSKIGWKVKKEKGVLYFAKNILPFITINKIQRPNQINLNLLKKIKSCDKITINIVEPKNKSQVRILERLNFKRTTPYLPSKTLIINLKLKKQEILKNTKKDCLLSIKKTEKIKLYECQRTDLLEFHKIWKKSVNSKRYVPPLNHLQILKKTFGKNSLFLLYKDKEKAFSGGIFLKNKDCAYYWQAFTNKKARKKLIQYQIVWQAICWAKKSGCKIFDFEGIFDPRFPNKSWLGFTHFKKSFGGKELSYPGAFMKIGLNFR
jgi:hypothetical protein